MTNRSISRGNSNLVRAPDSSVQGGVWQLLKVLESAFSNTRFILSDIVPMAMAYHRILGCISLLPVLAADTLVQSLPADGHRNRCWW
ncbi:hypothetical protein Tco_0794975 [Tanacetum coccineum]